MSGEAPKLSILMPVFNDARFLDEAIRSVVEQSFCDLELVAVDDHSTDQSWDKLREWQERDSRIRAHRNGRNLGMTTNWNRCLELAAGDLVLKLDADDLLRPRTLEILVAPFEDPRTIGAGSRTVRVDVDLEPIDGQPADDEMMRAGISPYRDHDLETAQWLSLALEGVQLWHSCAFVVRREVLSALGGWDSRFGCASDTELLLRILRRDGRFGHRAHVGVWYRLTGDSVSAYYRANDLLRWETTVIALRSIARESSLDMRLRRRRADLWKIWQSRPATVDEDLPELRGAMADVSPPPLPDRVIALLAAAKRKVVR
ncbi:MAG: glycosyltransferase family 2 protein [Acidobacteria bacterium]|nr:glycosyltransferase family 2 protein [Acidobacteriota bacterium]